MYSSVSGPPQHRQLTKGVYKQWNGLLEWTTGMVEYWNGEMEFFKGQYQFLHPNKYNPSH